MQGAGSQAGPDDVVVRLRLGDGSNARSLLQEDDAATVTALLRERTGAREAPTVVLPDAGRRRWPLALLAVGLLWFAGCGSLYGAGAPCPPA